MDLIGIHKSSEKAAESILKKFTEVNSQSTRFELKLSDRKTVWNDLFLLIKEKTGLQPSLQLEALSCARILSREKNGLNESISEEMIETLMQLSITESQSEKDRSDEKVTLEGLKVLSNLLHQSCVVQSFCTKNGFLSKIVSKISNYKKYELESIQNKIFDFRLLFLFTALCPEQREIAKYNHEGVKLLCTTIDDIIKEKSSKDEQSLGEEECSLICEILKVIFNLTLNSKVEDTEELVQVAMTLNKTLRTAIGNFDSKLKVVNNCINVITNMEGKSDAFKELLKPVEMPTAEKDIMYEQIIVNNVQTFLDFLTFKIDNTQAGSTLKEDITPCLSVLWNMSRSVRLVRKFIRSVILPPLTAIDIKEKPEEGNTLKAKLVGLLTNTNGDISTMVAELLYVLCKENVGRLIKHTGYGNAAGLLARRGLMAGGGGSGDFSEDEESDTEEYLQERHKINPIIGCVEEPKVSPLEGMTDEQKEYEAMQLVNLMDKMQRTGLISPCRVGEDGRPEPVDHVLQLIEEKEANKPQNDEDE